jgi:hypothetical protein
VEHGTALITISRFTHAHSIFCSCGKKLSVPDISAGKQVKCPGCQAVTRVPDTAAGEPAPVAASEPARQKRVGAGAAPQDRPDEKKTPKKSGCGMLVLIAVGLVLLTLIGAALLVGAFFMGVHKPFVADVKAKGNAKDDDNDNGPFVKRIDESDSPLREFVEPWA